MWRAVARLRDPRRWPLRWWLTVVTAAIAGGTLVVLGVLVLVLLDGSFQGLFASYLRDQAEPVIQRQLGTLRPEPKPIVGLLPEPPSKPSAPKPGGKPSGVVGVPDDRAIDLKTVGPALVQELAAPDTGVVVFDVHHTVIVASGPDRGPASWPVAASDAVDETIRGKETRRIFSHDGHRTLLLLLPLQTPDGRIGGAIEIASRLDLLDRLRVQLSVGLAVGTLLALAVAGGIAGWVVRIALGPLERMVLVTRQVAGGDLRARVRVERQDEVGELAGAFDQMVDRLEAAFAEQRRLVSDAAHELRTPLTAIGGTMEMAQVSLDRSDDAMTRQLLATSEREIDRLGRLVNDLLALSSLDERTPLHLESLDLGGALTDVVERTRLLAREHQVVACLDPADGPFLVRGDRDQLERLFVNLLDNATKYTPDGGRIEVRLSRTDDLVCATVQDTGRGIAPDDLPRIFDRFYRGDRSRSRRAGGAGLGLSIVQGIVSAHGGTIEAESTLGVGTTIRVFLPRAAS
jgi:two-component system OmpR family sensor kinase